MTSKPPLVLVTGFGPFADVARNPSGLLAEGLAAAPPAGCRVAAEVLPVTFGDAPGALEAFVRGHEERSPAALLSMGVHPGAGFRLERRARVRPTSAKLDNSGVVGGTFEADRERRTSLDLERLQAELEPLATGGLRVSEDAGGYVCDWVYQHLLGHAERLGVPALFLHVPPLELVPLDGQRRLVEALVTRLPQFRAAR